MGRQADLKRIVSALASDIGVRSYRHPERLNQAADLISREFRDAGYVASRQTFFFEGNRYDNIIAEAPGRSSPDKILVLGAHYDTVLATPGADDNASGVATLLEIARDLAAGKPGKTVRLAAFALEEPPAYRTRHMGSYHYARSLNEARTEVEGMVCLEMVGYFSDLPGSQSYPLSLFKWKYPAVGNYLSLVGNMRSRQFTERIAAGIRRAVDLPVVTLNAPALVPGIDLSDHWSFNQFGYNALMVTDTAFYRNPHYHEPTDTPETLDYDRMAQVVNGLVSAVEEWGEGR
jgi:Zn-dependent M28 family amino/carboxypeptidase